MAILIKITKIFQTFDVGYYLIEKNRADDIDFFMAIDKGGNKIQFYLDNKFSGEPIKTIIPDSEEPIGCLPGVSMSTYWRVLMRALKALSMEDFPEYLDYAA